MSFVEFQDGRRGGHLGYRNGTPLAILNLYVAPMPSIKFRRSIWLMVWEEMSFETFQDGCHSGHLECRNRTILAILNLCVTVMPPKFWLNPTCGLGGNVVWRISRWSPWRPSWISNRNDFSISESLCYCDASNQVLAQSDLGFGRRCHLKNFKMAAMAFLAILNLHVATMPPTMFQLNPTYCSVGDVKMWKANDGRTTNRRRTTGHCINWPGAKLKWANKLINK